MTDHERAVLIDSVFAEAIRLHGLAAHDEAGAILRVVDAVACALADGGKILVCGNGGSAADAQHFAAELVGRFTRERCGLSAIALTTDTSILTAISNDYGYDRVFARQVEAHGRPGDVLVGISTSGGSPNVLAALATARAAGMTTVALTGRDGGAIGAAADIHVNVPSPSAARAQEVHRTILHVICELVEAGI
ncbi:MAG: D-sedoheptulose 7-phosphate isomerase [Planctomycetes bacterium]|nr:D-sedoheptulose 7-phosphate isomerase [Planctomycetota bacterium]